MVLVIKVWLSKLLVIFQVARLSVPGFVSCFLLAHCVGVL